MTLAEVAEYFRSKLGDYQGRCHAADVLEADPDFTLRARYDALVASLERLAGEMSRDFNAGPGSILEGYARRLREVRK